MANPTTSQAQNFDSISTAIISASQLANAQQDYLIPFRGKTIRLYTSGQANLVDVPVFVISFSPTASNPKATETDLIPSTFHIPAGLVFDPGGVQGGSVTFTFECAFNFFYISWTPRTGGNPTSDLIITVLDGGAAMRVSGI